MADKKPNVIRWLIAGAGAAILLLNLPNGITLSTAAAPLLIAFALTGLAVLFNVTLITGELNLAHGIGMVACLSLPADAQNGALWAVGLGALVGEFIRLIWEMTTRFRGQAFAALSPSAFASVGRGFGHTAISFYAASLTYRAMGGALPFTDLTTDTIIPLIAFVIVYIAVTGGLFLLESSASHITMPGTSWYTKLRGGWLELLSALILPTPFAILTAEAYSMFSRAAFVLLIAALVMVILFMYGISHARLRLRRRMEELESLASMSETLQTTIELKPLVRSIENHVQILMGVRDVDILLRETNANGALVDASKQDDNVLLAYVQSTGAPLLLSARVGTYAAQKGLRVPDHLVSWLGVPMMSGGKTRGVLAVESYTHDRLFDHDDLRRLTIIAAGASVALENVHRQEEQSARVEQLATLNNILALLSGTLSPDIVLDTVITSASALSGASAVTLYSAWDEHQSVPTLVRCAGLSGDLVSNPPTPLMVGQTRNSRLSGNRLNGQPPLVVSDVNTDPRTVHLRERMRSANKRSWIELPLSVGGIGKGVICLYFDEPLTLSAEGIELLRTFANQAAQAIENARLFAVTDENLERRIGQLLVLASIGQELTAIINLTGICDVVLKYAIDSVSPRSTADNALNIVAGCMALYKEHGTLDAWAAQGYLDTPFDANPTEKLLPGWRAAQKETNAILTVVDGNPPDYAQLSAPHTTILAPILRGSTHIGFLMLETDAPSGFTFDESQFIGQLATQAVIAIDNARLFRRIAEALDRLRVILNAMDEAILLIDADGRIALANPRISMLGLSMNDLIGGAISDLVGENDITGSLGFQSNADLQQLVTELHGTWTEHPPVTYTIIGKDDDELTIVRHTIPVYDDGGKAMGALLVFHDESEAARLAQAREDFSRMIVHDLRGPLTAITTSLSLLTTTIPKDSPYREMVETTSEASRRSVRKLLERVNALMDVARLESGNMKVETHPTDLATLIDNVSIELSPLAHELNIKIAADIPDDLPALAIDADKVERVLLNLVDNALKFSPMDSVVQIRAVMPDDGSDTDDTIPFVRVEVIDQGPGIPNEDKTRLFDRFAQVKGRTGRRRGTGLGLTFCRLVSEAHGGRIWIEDNPAGGSIFAFTLPATENGNE